MSYRIQDYPTLIEVEGRKVRRRRMHPGGHGVSRAIGGRREEMEFMASSHRPAEGQGEEARLMESVSTKQPLQGGCWLHESRVWIDGRILRKVKDCV